MVVGEIVARYFEPFRKKVLEASVLACEILKSVITKLLFETTFTL